MRRSPTLGAAVIAALGTFAPVAHAQLPGFRTGTGNNLNVEHYDPPASPLGMANILDAESQDWREWSVGLYLHYARNQLVLFQDRLQIGEVVGHRVSADIVGSVGILRWLEFGAVLPVTFWQKGDDGLGTGTLGAGGIRDPRVHLKIQVADQKQIGLFNMALVPELSIPIGDDASFLSDGGIVFTPALVIDRSFDVLWGLRAGVSLGGRIRPRSEIGNIEVGSELFYRLGVGVGLPNFLDAMPEVIGELNGVTGIESLFAGSEVNPASPTLALRMHHAVAPGHMLVSTGGVTVGATRGYGSPDAQVFFGIAYRRWLSDRDGDGIYDDDDFCPDDPEDKDGFEDADGCPDPDNDKDGIPDVADRCPNEPEDIDGFEDLDGCPDPDNDQDKILDVDDKCPNQPEDYDGFEDADGCPDPDNDVDGIPDELDRCPLEKEVINGVEDEDGCPDEGESHVQVTSEKITIDTKIFFEFDSAKIKEESFNILNQVGLTILANPQIKRLRIEGHADERGGDDYNLLLTQRRAESVMEYLISRRVSPERLEAVGYGETRPLDPAHTEEAWAMNRRVEFTIVERVDATEGGRTLEIPVD